MDAIAVSRFAPRRTLNPAARAVSVAVAKRSVPRNSQSKASAPSQLDSWVASDNRRVRYCGPAIGLRTPVRYRELRV